MVSRIKTATSEEWIQNPFPKLLPGGSGGGFRKQLGRGGRGPVITCQNSEGKRPSKNPPKVLTWSWFNCWFIRNFLGVHFFWSLTNGLGGKQNTPCCLCFLFFPCPTGLGILGSQAIQSILRREGYPKPYEALRDLTRTNEAMTKTTLGYWRFHTVDGRIPGTSRLGCLNKNLIIYMG